MKTALIDSSSAILLFKADLISQLLSAYRVVTSRSIYHELTVEDHAGNREFKDYFEKNMFNICEAGDISSDNSLKGGEKEIIHLYNSGFGDFIIIDDRKGAKYCRRRVIPYINALLVPAILLFSGIIAEQEYIAARNSIVQNGRYSTGIIRYAQSVTSRDMAYFFP